jgi:NRAMP (natural resistance-associated macrophage protein)-like metal ion transporter
MDSKQRTMKLSRRILIFLSVLGPSVIATMAGNDGGGIITYSLAGARLGYAALITLPYLTILYAVTQEMGSRIAIVTGKGLGDLIRERFGVRIAFVFFTLILLANFGTLLTNIAALKTCAQMLGIQPAPLIFPAIVVAFVLIVLTSYEKSQRVFLTGMALYLAYVFSAVMGNPSWGEAFRCLFIPKPELCSKGSFLLLIAVLGTTITPWGQFFVQSYMKDKNVPVENLGFAKLEAYLGAFLSNFFTFFIILATASTLFVRAIPLESGVEAAMAIRPFAGRFAGLLFAVGLVNAAILGMIVVSLTSAYAFAEFFGFTGSLDEPYDRAKRFYGLFLFNLLVAAFLAMTPFFPLFSIVLYTQSLNGVLLPVFFFFILKIINNREIMGYHVNGRFYNIFAYGSSILIVLASAIAVVTSLLGI